MANKKVIKVGVLGVGRGMSFAKGAASAGLELVAICDQWKEKLQEAGKSLNVKTFEDFDKFLKHDMDAVILANYFHEHSPFAIKALKAGKHVMSETACNSTLAEGAALCRAVEDSGLIYMLAENYPYTVFNQEMRRVYRSGEIGKVTYAEGEYNHPMEYEKALMISPGLNHWRRWCPSTYYCTHALAPLMYITDTMPIKINALSIACPEKNKKTISIKDRGSIILCQMDNGSVFRLLGGGVPGHSNWYRVHGSSGAMENTRGPGYFGPGQVRVWHDEWDQKGNEPLERTYLPEWPEHGDLAKKAGHGGGDFFTNFNFAQAILTKKQPYLDVYKGVAMSSVGILAWKSALEDGKPIEVPNFKKESDRKKLDEDHWSPFPEKAGPGQPPSSILGKLESSPKAIAYAKAVWKRSGYKGK
jgi:predicted dehydrogenase